MFYEMEYRTRQGARRLRTVKAPDHQHAAAQFHALALGVLLSSRVLGGYSIGYDTKQAFKK